MNSPLKILLCLALSLSLAAPTFAKGKSQTKKIKNKQTSFLSRVSTTTSVEYYPGYSQKSGQMAYYLDTSLTAGQRHRFRFLQALNLYLFSLCRLSLDSLCL